MKKVSLKARFLLLSCLALGAGALSAHPAQADWRVSFTDAGPNSVGWRIPYGTPSGWVNNHQGLNGLGRQNMSMTSNPNAVSHYDYLVQATLHWEGNASDKPSTVAVHEKVTANSVVAPNDGYERTDYGSAIQFVSEIPTSNLPSGVTPTTTFNGTQKLTVADFTRTYNVDYNGDVTLPPRRIKSDLIINWAAEPSIPPAEYPQNYFTNGLYDVSV